MKQLLPVLGLCGCGLGGSLDLPLISPPVRAATPPALGGTTAMHAALDATLSPSDLHDRFFSGNGPTDLMTVLGWIDQRIAEIDDIGPSACLDAAPIDTPLATIGESMTIAASCYRRFDGDGFMQFAVVGDTTSFYVTGGAVRMAATITALGGEDYSVDAWYGVGYTNASSCGTSGTFDGCSYGVTALRASSAAKTFEMSVAGLGEGYCGVQLQSDGATLYGIGSTDMGATCNTSATLCVDANDLTVSATCAPALTLPALGRHAGAGANVFGASQYPDAPNVVLDGTDADSLHFGPTAPSPGVAEL